MIAIHIVIKENDNGNVEMMAEARGREGTRREGVCADIVFKLLKESAPKKCEEELGAKNVIVAENRPDVS